MLTLITPTSDRPRAFELCERWMSRQTYAGPLHWIVVDDGTEKVTCTMGQDHVHRPAGDSPTDSFRNNLVAGLKRAESFGARKLLTIEDDDAYLPGYLEHMSAMLDRYQLVGQGNARYYHVPARRWRLMGNPYHASLAQTGLSGPLIRGFRVFIERTRGFHLDMAFWRSVDPLQQRLEPESTLCCGLKGLPGKTGLGIGHKPKGRHDPAGHQLAEWIGREEADYVLAMVPEESCESIT